MNEITMKEEFLFEIGYYMARSGVLTFRFGDKINYDSLKYVHFYWRQYRDLDVNGEKNEMFKL